MRARSAQPWRLPEPEALPAKAWRRALAPEGEPAALSLAPLSREPAWAAEEAARPLSWRGRAVAAEGAAPARRLRRGPGAQALARGAAEVALVRRSPPGASPVRAHWRQAEQAGSG